MGEGPDPFELRRDLEAELRQGEALFDARLAELRGGRAGSHLERRRAAIQALIDRGATPGERAAAQAAMLRLTEADAIGEFPAAAFEQDDPDEED